MEGITHTNGSDKEVIGTVKRLMTDERAYRKFLKDVHGPAEAEKLARPSAEAYSSFYRADQRATAFVTTTVAYLDQLSLIQANTIEGIKAKVKVLDDLATVHEKLAESIFDDIRSFDPGSGQ